MVELFSPPEREVSESKGMVIYSMVEVLQKLEMFEIDGEVEVSAKREGEKSMRKRGKRVVELEVRWMMIGGRRSRLIDRGSSVSHC